MRLGAVGRGRAMGLWAGQTRNPAVEGLPHRDSRVPGRGPPAGRADRAPAGRAAAADFRLRPGLSGCSGSRGAI